MTLVVSDISHHGIIMVGDSAKTLKQKDSTLRVISGAVKVQYCKKANIGIAMWGQALVGNQRLDNWISTFIEQSISTNEPVEIIGNKLANQLNPILQSSGKTWKDLVCGFHIGGYRDNLPVLFHVHCGHNNEPAHELRLYKEYPDDQKWSEYLYNYYLNYQFIHLRNGYHPLFGPLFDNILDYSNTLRASFNISFPKNTLTSRFEFYKLLVKFVAGILPVADIHPSVNQVLSSIAFTKDGIEINEQLPFDPQTYDADPNLSIYF